MTTIRRGSRPGARNEAASEASTVHWYCSDPASSRPEGSSGRASNSMVSPREDFALVLESAFFYAIGGSTDGTNAVASVDTVIY